MFAFECDRIHLENEIWLGKLFNICVRLSFFSLFFFLLLWIGANFTEIKSNVDRCVFFFCSAISHAFSRYFHARVSCCWYVAKNIYCTIPYRFLQIRLQISMAVPYRLYIDRHNMFYLPQISRKSTFHPSVLRYVEERIPVIVSQIRGIVH